MRSRLLIAALLLLGSRSAAQSVVRGRVLADSGKQPIAGAEVLVVVPSRTARSDGTGRFVLGDLPAGTLALRIRAVGFKPLDLEADIGAHDTVDVEFGLTRAPQQLAPLVVREKAAPRISAKMEVFEQRRKLGFGKFLSRTELVKWQDQPLSVALRQTGNLRLVARPLECGGGFAAATGRGGQQLLPCGVFRIGPACFLAIFFDGALAWAPGMGDAPPDIDQYRADQLQGAEVYLGPGQLPAELQQTGTSCGALVLWTRTGETEAAPRRVGPPRPTRDSTKPPA